MPSQDEGAPHLLLDSHVASSHLRLTFELLENSLDKSGQTWGPSSLSFDWLKRILGVTEDQTLV